MRGRSDIRYGSGSTGCIKNVVTQQIIDSFSNYKFLKGVLNISLGWVALVFRDQESPVQITTRSLISKDLTRQAYYLTFSPRPFSFIFFQNFFSLSELLATSLNKLQMQ
jgi:hypothetical protein